MPKFLSSSRCYCVPLVVAGLFNLFGTNEKPQDAVNRFIQVFTRGDAAGLMKMIQPDVVRDKEIRPDEVEGFLRRYRSRSVRLQSARIDRRFKGEDGKAGGFQATLHFRASVLAKKYPNPPTLEMTLLWGIQKKKFWLERPVSINYRVTTKRSYPTAAQDEAAMRFEAALGVLERIGLCGKEDLYLIGKRASGSGLSAYKELEKLHKKERGAKGVNPTARGVAVFLKGAARKEGGFLKTYHGDFKTSPKDRRGPVPWDMFRDYAQAAVRLAKTFERRGNVIGAEKIYRRLISFGRQILDEPGGFQFVNWGLTFEHIGAQQLVKLTAKLKSPDREKAAALVNLLARRIDLLRTAHDAIDNMEEYRSLKAAIIASRGVSDPIFRAWGINSLAIMAVRGAPADRRTTEAAGALVLLNDPVMQKVADSALNRIASDGGSGLRAVVRSQREWAKGHKVYGTAPRFQ